MEKRRHHLTPPIKKGVPPGTPPNQKTQYPTIKNPKTMKSAIIDLNKLSIQFRGYKNGKTLLCQAIELERMASPDKNPYMALWCPKTDQEKRIHKAYNNELMAHSRATRFYLGDIYDFTTTIERMNHKNA